MAKAELVTPAPPPEVVLTLTMEEARAVRSVVGKITGGGNFREMTDAVWYALAEAGVEPYRSLNSNERNVISSRYFDTSA